MEQGLEHFSGWENLRKQIQGQVFTAVSQCLGTPSPPGLKDFMERLCSLLLLCSLNQRQTHSK